MNTLLTRLLIAFGNCSWIVTILTQERGSALSYFGAGVAFVALINRHRSILHPHALLLASFHFLPLPLALFLVLTRCVVVLRYDTQDERNRDHVPSVTKAGANKYYDTTTCVFFQQRVRPMARRVCQLFNGVLRSVPKEALQTPFGCARSYCLGLSSTGTLNRFYDKASVSEAPGAPVRCCDSKLQDVCLHGESPACYALGAKTQ